MPDKNAREKLLDLLDRKAFEPVLNASADDYDSEEQRKKLRDVQGTTRSTQRRYHDDYKTAEEVEENFRADLSSDPAQAVQRDLRDLGLPTLQDIEGEFKRLADELGV